MEMWTEIRRKVLVEGASKRSILREYKISAGVLEKILAHTEPPGYRQSVPRPKPELTGRSPAWVCTPLAPGCRTV